MGCHGCDSLLGEIFRFFQTCLQEDYTNLTQKLLHPLFVFLTIGGPLLSTSSSCLICKRPEKKCNSTEIIYIFLLLIPLFHLKYVKKPILTPSQAPLAPSPQTPSITHRHIPSSSSSTSKSNLNKSSLYSHKYVSVILKHPKRSARVTSHKPTSLPKSPPPPLPNHNKHHSPPMLPTPLIRLQRLPTPVVTQKHKLETFALLPGFGDGGAADEEPVVEDAGEGFEGFEVRDEGGFVGGGDGGEEFEGDCWGGKKRGEGGGVGGVGLGVLNWERGGGVYRCG